MDCFLALLASFLAYRMGARGWWLWAVVLLSWPAFFLWLTLREPDKKILRRREDADLERTLMIVRAINPAMADKIEVDKAIERALADGPTHTPRGRPLRPQRRKMSKPMRRRIAWSAAAVFGGLVLIDAVVAPLIHEVVHQADKR